MTSCEICTTAKAHFRKRCRVYAPLGVYRRGELTYRFGPPEVAVGEDSAHRVQNTEEFLRAHGRGGAGELLRGHPKMASYEVAVERGPEVLGAG